MVRIHRKRKFPTEWDRELGLWITYQLKRAGWSKQEIARQLRVSREAIVLVSYRRSTSRRIRKAIAEAIGFNSWDDLVSAFEQTKEGAA